jgi:hypothetical protein
MLCLMTLFESQNIQRGMLGWLGSNTLLEYENTSSKLNWFKLITCKIIDDTQKAT